jgi:hypothetical protein
MIQQQKIKLEHSKKPATVKAGGTFYEIVIFTVVIFTLLETKILL